MTAFEHVCRAPYWMLTFAMDVALQAYQHQLRRSGNTQAPGAATTGNTQEQQAELEEQFPPLEHVLNEFAGMLAAHK